MIRITSSLILLFLLLAVPVTAQLNRAQDIIVLSGSVPAGLQGIAPAELVAFRWSGSAWQQVPVQVDERATLDIMKPYGTYTQGGFPNPSGYTLLLYTDAGTHTGADTDANLDDDDEIVLRAAHAGMQRTTGADPAGTVAGSCTQLHIADPLGGSGYIYLFKHDGSLVSSAGAANISYSYNLTAGAYPADFTINTGRNAESSKVATATYELHFSAEWIMDSLKVFAGTSTGSDILDRYQNYFSPGFCGRSEDTFSDAENAFICNKTGPIRAIRSVMGANSGPLTMRTHHFYADRVDFMTDLRVHSIPSVYDVFDYEESATGMTYYNNLNTTGLTMDGAGDNAVTGAVNWEMVTGPHGTLHLAHKLRGNLALPADATRSSIWDDDNQNGEGGSCTGNGKSFGNSGHSITFGTDICTDPVRTDCAPTANYRSTGLTRQLYFSEPNQTSIAAAETRYSWLAQPLVATAGACPSCTNPPVADAGADQSQCSGASYGLTASASGGTAPYTFSWDDGTSGATWTGTAAAAGIRWVAVTDDSGCESRDTLNLALLPGPAQPTVQPLGTDSLTASIAGDTYLWYLDGTALAAAGRSILATETGDYTVQVVAQSCTSAVSLPYQFTPVGIIADTGLQWQLYPNPAMHTLNVSVPADATLTLISTIGQLMLETRLPKGSSLLRLDALPAGVYMARLSLPQGISSVRLLVVRK